MKRVYNLKVVDYAAYGSVEIDNEVCEVEVDFSVHNPKRDVSVDIHSVTVWDGKEYISPDLDLDQLADDIVLMGDANVWISDELNNSFDNALSDR